MESTSQPTEAIEEPKVQESSTQAPTEEAKDTDLTPGMNPFKYDYWTLKEKEFFKGTEKPDTAPKKLGEIQPGNEPIRQPITNAPAPWNKVGTWETKTLTVANLEEFLKEKIFSVPYIDKDSNQELKITKISKLGGEMSVVNNRGKSKLGYSLQMDVEIERNKKYITVLYSDFNDYGEHDYQLSIGTMSHSAADEHLEEVGRQLKEWIQEYANLSAKNK